MVVQLTGSELFGDSIGVHESDVGRIERILTRLSVGGSEREPNRICFLDFVAPTRLRAASDAPSPPQIRSLQPPRAPLPSSGPGGGKEPRKVRKATARE